VHAMDDTRPVPAGDLLVRGGQLLDGTGAPARDSDVRVRGGRVVEVATRLEPDGERVIDADGAFVAPGFIDSHTHYDPTLFWDPYCDPAPQHGVTSALIGNCSLTLVPLRAEHRDGVTAVFSYIEDIPLNAFKTAVDWSWESYPEYVAAMRRRSFGLNIGQQVGHSPLRLFVMGGEAWDRVATAEERVAMAGILDEALTMGALGLSTSFFDEDKFGRPVPSRLADDAEYETLFDVLAKHDAFVEFIPGLNGPRPKDDIERVARLCRPRGVFASFNGIFHSEDRPEGAVKLLDFCADLQAGGARMFAQISPRTLDMRVSWDNSILFMALKDSWQQIIRARGEEMGELLRDPAWRARARADWDANLPRLNPFQRPWRIRLIEVTRPENEPWLGRSLADLVADRGGHISDVLADWVLANDLNPGVVGVGVANSDPAGVAETLVHPAAIVSNSDAGAHVQMMCASGDTTLLLTRHVRDRGDLSLERAVYELTGRQADAFGMRGRGRVEPGKAGDLVVFDLDELRWHDDSFVPDLPDGSSRLRRPGGGYRYTVVGGTVTQEADTLTGERPGVLLEQG
jgi:N-acyl-D-aspartate/D-glutamate deacylase